MKPVPELSPVTMGDVGYLKAALKDPQMYLIFEKQSLNRARRMSLILGTLLIAALGSVVFAFVQDKKLQVTIDRGYKLKNELAVCIQEAQKQQGLAAENMLILSEVNKMAEEQLRACQSKK